MSFSDNLQFLRKSKGITQEQLAERLNVSRQSVSKWESGMSYPETEKLLTLCDMFGCDMDTLMRGDVSRSFKEDRYGYDAHKTRFANAITFGVGFIILGISLMMLLIGLGVNDELATTILLAFITVSVVVFVSSALLNDRFNKAHPVVEDFYTQEQKNKIEKYFIISITAGVGLILLGVIMLVGSEAIALPVAINEDIATAVFMLLVSIGVTVILRAALIRSKLEIKEHNRENGPQTRGDKVSGAIHGAIWLIAIAVYLIISFSYDSWGRSWLVFPVAAMLSGAVSLVVPLFVKDSNNKEK